MPSGAQSRRPQKYFAALCNLDQTKSVWVNEACSTTTTVVSVDIKFHVCRTTGPLCNCRTWNTNCLRREAPRAQVPGRAPAKTRIARAMTDR